MNSPRSRGGRLFGMRSGTCGTPAADASSPRKARIPCISKTTPVVSEGLVESVTRAIGYSLNHPIGLFAPASIRVLAALALKPAAWWTGDGPSWGVAAVFPTDDIPELLHFADRMRTPHDDQRIWHFYMNRLPCWYTAPSLVDHRDEGSLVGKPKSPRKAAAFGSGLGIDWSQPPLPTNRDNLYPIVTLTKDGRSRRVRRYTQLYRRLISQGWT